MIELRANTHAWALRWRMRRYVGGNPHLFYESKVLSYTTAPNNGWQVPVGVGPRQAATITRVHGSLFVGSMYPLPIDLYAVLDSKGLMLGFFRSGGESSIPWYTPDDVTAFAAKVGVCYNEVEVHWLEEVMTQFPGILKQAVVFNWLTYLISLTYTSFGIFMLYGVTKNPLRLAFSLSL